MEKWYEKLNNQCPKCKKYEALELIKYGKKYYEKMCKFCGFKKKNIINWAEYKHENGNTFLRTNNWKEWREVELVKYKDGSMKVQEKKNEELKRLSQMGIFG